MSWECHHLSVSFGFPFGRNKVDMTATHKKKYGSRCFSERRRQSRCWSYSHTVRQSRFSCQTPVLGRRAWGKHRLGQGLALGGVGTDMEGRHFSTACVSLLTSARLDVRVQRCGHRTPAGTLASCAPAEAACSGPLLVTMLLKYCPDPFRSSFTR